MLMFYGLRRTAGHLGHPESDTRIASRDLPVNAWEIWGLQRALLCWSGCRCRRGESPVPNLDQTDEDGMGTGRNDIGSEGRYVRQQKNPPHAGHYPEACLHRHCTAMLQGHTALVYSLQLTLHTLVTDGRCGRRRSYEVSDDRI
jgi:hypothetical protein